MPPWKVACCLLSLLQWWLLLTVHGVLRIIREQAVDEKFQEAAVRLASVYEQARSAERGGVSCARESITASREILSLAARRGEAFLLGSLKSLGREMDSLSVLQQSSFAVMAPLFAIVIAFQDSAGKAFRRQYLAVVQKYYIQAFAEAARKFSATGRIIPMEPTPLIGDLPYDSGMTLLHWPSCPMCTLLPRSACHRKHTTH